MPNRATALATRADELVRSREPFVWATVVRAQRPTSAHAGDTALVHADGQLEGFVGGACTEGSVRKYAMAVLSSREPLLLRVRPGEPSGAGGGSAPEGVEEGAVAVTNPCLSGGAVEIFLEPRLPPPRVLVVGRSPVAQALAALGACLDMDVELADGAAAAPGPEDAALIVASHGRDEERPLVAALTAGVPYVALVASEARGAAVVGSLPVEEELRSRVHTPAGLRLGARTPGEVALSILAQLVAQWSAQAQEKAPPRTPTSARTPASPPASAVDPVCHMAVAAELATPQVERGGTVTYFCCAACRTAFLADPDRYAVAS